MRIIVWGINYAPELTGIAPFNTGLCDHLRAAGHEVEMVTTFPYYPFWRKIPGDQGRHFRTDEIDGVPVHRCWHYVPSHATTLRRIWHELSFGLTSLWRVLRLPVADVYVVVSPPLILGPFARMACGLKRRPYVFHVQDLQPDAAVGLGMVSPGLFTRLLYRLEALAYAGAARVSGISSGMISAFQRKGVPEEKRLLFPNWIRWYGRSCELVMSADQRRDEAGVFRRKYQVPEGAFFVSYSGNLGRKQSLEALLDAAAILYSGFLSPDDRAHEKVVAPPTSAIPGVEREILIFVVGEGVMRDVLAKRIVDAGLKNVRLMPLLIENDYRAMLAASDVSVILQSSGTGQYFFPSKLLSALSTGTPILSVADEDSELARAVDEGKFGVNVLPAQPDALARALVALANDPAALATMRENTRWVRRFSPEAVLEPFERELRKVVGG